MIKSFRHKGLKLLWESNAGNKLPPDQLAKIKQILILIDNASMVPQDFGFFKSLKIHPLKGELKNFWSLTVKGNWRIIFQFEEENAFGVDYLDYH